MSIRILDPSISSSVCIYIKQIKYIMYCYYLLFVFYYMIQFQIFPNSKEFPVPLYSLLCIIVCMGLYYALFKYNLQKIIQKLFSLSNQMSYVQSTIYYLFLINFPLIMLSILSIILNNNVIGFQISCDVDHIQIIIISAYICYVEESRQTPIRGFLFVRDLLTVIMCLGTLIYFYYDGILRLQYGIIILTVFLLYYILQHFEQVLQDQTLRMLGFKQSNVYNSQFLQTQIRKQANLLKIKSTIEQNRMIISRQIQQFKQITSRLYSSQDQKQILLNFAKLFLPYKNAVQIQEQNQLKQNINRIYQDWIDSDRQQEDNGTIQEKDQQYQQDSSHLKPSIQHSKGNLSGSCLIYQRTMTDDYVLETNLQMQQQSTFELGIRYVFYPLYYISTLDGRIRYFMDYLCMALLCGAMVMISYSCDYFIRVTQHYSYCIVSVIVAVPIVVPSSKYYLRISITKDFDFINIFLQSSIIKTVIFGLVILILYIVDPSATPVGSVGLTISLGVNLLTYCIFGGYMIAQKFATRKINLNFMVGLSICSFLLRIFGQLSYNVVRRQQS